jgi:hypothetical protein
VAFFSDPAGFLFFVGGLPTEEKPTVAYAIDRREIPPLRRPTPSQERRRKAKASACFGRDDRSGLYARVART